MLIKKTPDIASSEITSESVYLNRRQFMGSTLAAGGVMAVGAAGFAQADDRLKALNYIKAKKGPEGFYTDEELTPYDDVASYNNFYEFGTGKTDPARNAHTLTTDPWSIVIEGEVENPGTYQLEDILSKVDLEERIYRLRCVEAWSMVVPWIGFSLADLIKQMQPTSKAKYIAFETLYRPREMKGQRSRTSTIDWPYVEGLRMDEAMHPLTLMSVGLYGKVLPNQNGAPIRLVVPWKYGFKSIKSIVKIKFLEKEPPTTWNLLQASEYGFYANVNPDVDHPRWSQKSERRLPSGIFSPNRILTEPFNGYGEQVASLYTGMDLRKFY
ncbi:MAG: protein-methionine-sulfoxide reductase catalytic subunit MsrP [Oceanicoccus sp.]|uniref:protein-methionine-sulfoxide reductase catalytic subunit MsrP n=1 Tax=Oceanicoccus sp. TaxID=2691044 RepID=UPI00261E8B81|nr:protein-methionine-sulfoxide reductase catalytic subunit MsrP [Oceanicoccus sp.]MCP3909169.1 protein-methionine-sulfoxide reductase catalytic subunit MsrP [Oceanicoccus sp.]MDG1773457.1 protein-methionine-sulfoxide reductase catalytic subunit MsrP [Oceanicoccus sp.]